MSVQGKLSCCIQQYHTEGVPPCLKGYCCMCQPDVIRYPVLIESAPAVRRAIFRPVMFLKLLLLGVFMWWCWVNVPWWMMFPEAARQLEFIMTSCGLHAAARVLLATDHSSMWCCIGCLCCARKGMPAPWFSVPQEFLSGLIPLPKSAGRYAWLQQVLGHAQRGYLHFVLHSELLEQISPHHF